MPIRTISSADIADRIASDMDFANIYSIERRGETLKKRCKPSPFSSSHIPPIKKMPSMAGYVNIIRDAAIFLYAEGVILNTAI